MQMLLEGFKRTQERKNLFFLLLNCRTVLCCWSCHDVPPDACARLQPASWSCKRRRSVSRCCAMKSGVETATAALLRTLPSVEKVLNLPTIIPLLSRYRHTYLVDIIRSLLTHLRPEMFNSARTAPLDENALLQRIKELLVRDSRSSLRTVINATGTVLHTNLGRALLAKAALDEVVRTAV